MLPIESLTRAQPLRRHRADQPIAELPTGSIAWWAILGALAVGFVLVGASDLDLGPVDARLGLAAGAGWGPFGQVFGGWATDVFPLPLLLGKLAALIGGTWASPGVVRWPSAIAGVVIGLLLARRVAGVLGSRAGLLVGLCWYGTVALMDHSAGLGLDLIAGLGTVAALDRVVAKRCDLVAGLWLSVAFLAGGWPTLLVVGLSNVVIQRPSPGVSLGFFVPVTAVVIGWTYWAGSAVSVEAWATAVGLPLTQKSAWGFAPSVLVQGWPWTPMVLLAAWPSIRKGWPAGGGRALVVSWLQVVGACLLVGTVVPGMSTTARLPVLAGLAIVSAAILDQAWSNLADWPSLARKGLFLLVECASAFWLFGLIAIGGYLALAVPYYRGVVIVLAILGAAIAAVTVAAARTGDGRRAVLALALIAASLKLGYAGYYVPEWNYRFGQGPWGRAIGQWVPARRLIYTTMTWPTDLAFATGRQFRQLSNPLLIDYQRDPAPRFVLLHVKEFEHWPTRATPLVKIFTFEDQYGTKRVLARTAGPYSWHKAALAGQNGDY